jgi:hypothetical protein
VPAVCAVVGVVDDGAGAVSSDAVGVDWTNAGRAVAGVGPCRAGIGKARSIPPILASISILASFE